MDIFLRLGSVICIRSLSTVSAQIYSRSLTRYRRLSVLYKETPFSCSYSRISHAYLNLKTMPSGDQEVEPETKRTCLGSSKSIGTHDGVFHCDEVLACFLLKLLPEYSDATIVRTRNEEELSKCDVVVDVGGVFDPSKHRYDHHQRSFNESMKTLLPGKPWVTKLSSAGLVYAHFGQRIIAQLLNSKPDDEITKVIYDKVYENFMEEIDAIDNGISTHDGPPRYFICTNLSSRVSHLHPPWNAESNDTEPGFYKAFEMVGTEFKEKVLYYGNVWWPARQLVKEAIEERYEVDPSGEVIKLKQGGCPWKDHLLSLEEEMKIEPKIKFVLYTDLKGTWRVQCVPMRLGSFENRLSLLQEWRGLRDEELSKTADIADCIFVHASGFIGGNKTEDGALKMAVKTLSAAKASA